MKEKVSNIAAFISQRLVSMSLDSSGLAPLMAYVATSDTEYYNKMITSEWKINFMETLKDLVLSLERDDGDKGIWNPHRGYT